MMHSGRHSVNVSRKDLLAKLKENREIHKKDYQEALVGYKIKLVADLKHALDQAERMPVERMQTLRAVPFDCPRSYEAEYNEIIDMMEVSVDDVINLDSSDFKSYFKNEWSWSNGFTMSANLYKSISASASAG